MKPERIWVCWSFEQACFHIETECAGLETNLRAFVLNKPVSFVPIAVFSNHQEASRFLHQFRDDAEKRQDAHAQKEEHKWN